jgi:hypothetical protein
MVVFFSWNAAWLVVWVAQHRDPKVVLVFSVHKLYLYVHTLEPEVVLWQALWSCSLAAVVSPAVWYLARFRVARALLCVSAGAVALAGFPVVALLYPSSFFQTLAFEDRFAVGFPWLICELVAVLACALLFSLDKWPVPAITSLVVCALHFGFWSWLTGMHVNIPDEGRRYWSVRALQHGPLWLAFLLSIWFFWAFAVLGFLATLTWGFYLRRFGANRKLAATPGPDGA